MQISSHLLRSHKVREIKFSYLSKYMFVLYWTLSSHQVLHPTLIPLRGWRRAKYKPPYNTLSTLPKRNTTTYLLYRQNFAGIHPKVREEFSVSLSLGYSTYWNQIPVPCPATILLVAWQPNNAVSECSIASSIHYTTLIPTHTHNTTTISAWDARLVNREPSLDDCSSPKNQNLHRAGVLDIHHLDLWRGGGDSTDAVVQLRQDIWSELLLAWLYGRCTVRTTRL